jgi:hypothetical protein
MGWIKYKSNFSSGHGEWIYKFFPFDEQDEDLKEWKTELDQNWNWSEHYRGSEVERVEYVTVSREEYDELIDRAYRVEDQAIKERRMLFDLLSRKQIAEFNRG